MNIDASFKKFSLCSLGYDPNVPRNSLRISSSHKHCDANILAALFALCLNFSFSHTKYGFNALRRGVLIGDKLTEGLHGDDGFLPFKR